MTARPSRLGRRGRGLAGLASVACAVLVSAMVVAGCAPSAERALGRASPPSFPPPTTPVPTVSPTPSPTQNPNCPTPPAGGGDSGQGGTSRLSWRNPSAHGATRTGESAAFTTAATRPSVSLCFAFASDHSTANGLEQVTFTPDRRVCQLVFRLWPNKPQTAEQGSRLRITTASMGGTRVKPHLQAAGAPKGAPGTLARLKLPACVKPGTQLQASLAFTLTLGKRADERVGYDPTNDLVWAGTAYPLLAWVPGKGWATDPAVGLYGETTTSTTFDLRQLLVIDNTGDTVMAAGKPGTVSQGATAGTQVHTFTAPAVRDVAITAGQTDTSRMTTHGVTVHLALPKTGRMAPPARWQQALKTALGKLIGQFGAFPYRHLWVSVLPDVRGGIEYPGALMLGNVEASEIPFLVTHELAHQWFYGLVGNDQAAHPWLDESFAQYAAVLLTARPAQYLAYKAPEPVLDQVGRSMQWYDRRNDPQLYTDGVYTQGAQMLLEVRKAVGPARFNRLLRGYLKANAHRIATPASVAKAFESSPKALRIFRQFGALR